MLQPVALYQTKFLQMCQRCHFTLSDPVQLLLMIVVCKKSLNDTGEAYLLVESSDKADGLIKIGSCYRQQS